MLRILRSNIIALIVAIIFSCLYGYLNWNVSRSHTTHIANLNAWVSNLKTNDTALRYHIITQEKWLDNRHQIFDDYLKAETENI